MSATTTTNVGLALTQGPWPYFAPDEVEAATRVLQSGKVNYWTGTEGRDFEREFAAWAGTRHAIAMSNGTVTLEAALMALGIGPGDEVVVTPRTFMASASCVVTVGATPVFADVDPDSGNLTAETIAAVLSPRTKAIIPVHLAGWPCEIDALLDLCRAHNLHLIEDCAQAHGSTYRGRSVGSFGVINSWSFCQDKIMTTGGEGGMITLDCDGLWSRLWSLKDHGKSYDAVYRREHAPGFRWLHESFGTNYRMTEMQSAIGRVQLRKLPDWVAARRAHAARLTEVLRDLPTLRIPEPGPHMQHAYYKYYAYLNAEALKPDWSQMRIIQEVESRGFKLFSGSCSEVYREKAFTSRGLGPVQPLPVARTLGETSLMMLVHPTLSPDYVIATAEALRDVLQSAQR